VTQELESVEDEKAAVGAVERAGADLVEVGDHRPELCAVLDAAQEVVVRRVSLHDDGSATRTVPYQHVDAVACEVLATLARLHRGEERRKADGLGSSEVTEVVREVVLDLTEVREHLGVVGVAFVQLVEERPDRELRNLTIEGADPFGGLLLELTEPAHGLRHAFLDLRAALIDLLPELRGQTGVVLARDRLALDERDRDHAGGRGLDREAALSRECLELARHLVAPSADPEENLAAAPLVIVALEGTRDLAARPLEELVHVAGEHRTLAGGERDRVRPARIGEVEDVHPVARRGPLAGHALEVVLDGARPARARRPRDEEVVARVVDLEAELDRVERSRLADRSRQGFDVGGGAERQLVREKAPPQLSGFELEATSHAAASSRAAVRGRCASVGSWAASPSSPACSPGRRNGRAS
jgi:hypothetical protein